MTDEFSGLVRAVEETPSLIPTELKSPVQELFQMQYEITDRAREQNIEEFRIFCYSIIKTMLASFPEELPNTSGAMLTQTIPMDEATQHGVISGTLVPKTGDDTHYVPIKNWNPVITAWLQNILDPLYQGAVALSEIDKPKQKTYRPVDTREPMALELLARFQVGLPIGEPLYGGKGAGYRIALRFNELFPSFMLQAIRENSVVPKIFQTLRGMEDICGSRLNVNPQ